MNSIFTDEQLNNMSRENLVDLIKIMKNESLKKEQEIRLLEEREKELLFLNALLSDRLTLAQRKQFGSSSEKTSSQLERQLSLFNEAEVEADADASEPLIERKGCYYKKNSNTKREELLKDLLVEEFPCLVHPADMFCKQCGSTLKEIGFVKVRDELASIQINLCWCRCL